jgi:hypothetical protein
MHNPASRPPKTEASYLLVRMVIMRDHDPRNASFESDSDTSMDYDGAADIEVAEERYARPSHRYIDVHDRPTYVP